MKHQLLMVATLAGLSFGSAIAVVYMKHLNRQMHSDISQSQKQMDELAVQWSQLQIEEGTFSEHGRVEETARERLGMVLPSIDDSIMITR
ncbi:MAG: cell division protein FtsL [Gammaproteobacteria bacterium]|nr:cell division protein FtsL [Gammaproteobacteria bacterium]